MRKFVLWSMSLLLAVGGPLGISSLMAAEKAEGAFPADWFFPVSPEQRTKLDSIVGKPMPTVAGTEWINGEQTADDLKGKVVIVDIWATWCGPCIRSIPHNNELYAKHKDEGLVIVGICSSQGQDKMGEVAETHKITYPIAKDPGNKIAKAWNAAFFPTYAVVDHKGIVRAVGLHPAGVEKAALKLLEEKKTAEKTN